MKKLRRDFERFCYRHQRKGIPNLMMYIAICRVVMYVLAMVDESNTLGGLFYFNRSLILEGQVWRLLTYIIVPDSYSVFSLLISSYFYYFIGKTMESYWGTFRFNLYYFTGVLITDAAAMILGYNAYITHLNLSLMLAYATMFPDRQILLMYIIPIRLKVLAWIYFAMILLSFLTSPLSYSVFSVFALLNYFLFFGADIVNVLPSFLQPKRRWKPTGGAYAPSQSGAKKAQKAKTVRGKILEMPYRHKCSVCGRTDQSDPNLEFRYCSKCSGYHCYCIDHINDHAHVE